MNTNPCEEKLTMPFSGHKPSEIAQLFQFINKCGMPIEAIDAFLAEYARTKDIQKSIWFAQCEWDL